jgi:outer membrane protein, multidrug efflux system
MRRALGNTLSIGVCASLLLGCAGRMPTLKPADVPGAWAQAVPADVPLWPEETWWNGFGSPELSAMIDAAQSGNLTLAAAAARVRQADARARQAGATLLPILGISASGTHLYGRSGGNSAKETDFAAGLSAGYELDFWGRNRDAWNSARAARNASRADRETVALTTIAGVANTYFELLSLRERLATARANLQSAHDVAGLVERRVRAGFAAPADLTQQLANIAAEEALVPQLEQQELEARGALAILLGRPPEGFDVKAQNLDGVLSPSVAPGLPSGLLARRPDVVAAEASLEAAHADLAAARAAFFPAIALTGSGGLQNPALNAAIAAVPGTGFGYAAGVTLVQTVFGGGLVAKEAEARARQQELLANYRSAAITAFSEVENTLGNLTHTTQRQAVEERHAALSEKVFEAAQRRYRTGSADFLAVAEAMRALNAARDQRVQVRLARLQATVALYKALGGGWNMSKTAGSQ